MGEAMTPERAALEELAAAHGVLTSYHDAGGRLVHASPEALVSVLRALGAPIERESDAPSALRARREASWERIVDPVLLCDPAGGLSFTWRIRASEADSRAVIHVEPVDLVPLRGGADDRSSSPFQHEDPELLLPAHPDPLPHGAGDPRSPAFPREGSAAPPRGLAPEDRVAEPRRFEVRAADLPRVGGERGGGLDHVAVEVRLPWRLEQGYHRLVLEAGRRTGEATIIAAPPAAPPWPAGRRAWGAFLPLHAAWRRDRPEIGDFTLLGDLASWTAAMGASFFGTLPLSAAFLDEPFDPSPYAPVSRLFLNEAYVDPWEIPELTLCPEALAIAERGIGQAGSGRPEATLLLAGGDRPGRPGVAPRMEGGDRAGEAPGMARGDRPGGPGEAPGLAGGERPGETRGLAGGDPPGERPVDYRRAFAFKREILSRLAADLAGRSTPRADAFREFARSEPELQGYARFRAATERLGRTWRDWPAALRDGAIGEADAPASSVLYHEYAQWVASEQMAEASRRARGAGARLYLDSPLGVHAAGYDAWRWRHLFAEGASTGAPPDALFTGGQDWGFKPPHPERMREDGYRYFAMGLRKAMTHAGLLRIDHVMSLQRLFWVPEGATAREGIYVRYPQEEMFAVLCLEAQRAGCTVIGEDLGTVPPEIREEMARRSLPGMHVMQIEIDGSGGLPQVPPAPVIASLNTHDMPTFAAFVRGLDLDDRHDLWLLDDAALEHEQARRREAIGALRRILRERGLLPEGEESDEALLKACLGHLAGGSAAMVQINLEDLWLETRPQNVPGTSTERPNWTRRARHAVEEITTSAEARRILEGVNRDRAAGKEVRP